MAKIPFNVSAKTARLIGRENVSNLEGALIELIKNTYDADAKKCVVYYEISSNRLFIIDNGTGMNKDVIINNWMTIGNSTKKDSVYTKSGRVNTGEKGIGRFALDRISEKCKMLTVTNEERFEWLVNWENFESSEMITDTYAELNDVSSNIPKFLQCIENKYLKKIIEKDFLKTGTCFVLENLRDQWNDVMIERVRNSLKKLLPPMENNVFDLYFFLEETKEEEAKVVPNLLNEYDYKLHFEVDDDAMCTVKIHRNEFFFGTQFEKIMKKAGFSEDDKEYFNDKLIVKTGSVNDYLHGIEDMVNIGSFSGDIYFYKLVLQSDNQEKYYYKNFITKRTNFKELSGIKIYRDDFLVRPYGIFGTTGYDWLDLSTRKAESPAAVSHKTGSWRVQANQICGQIKISRLNGNLPDKSSREGIVETREFKLFRELIIRFIEELEEDRQYVIRKLDKLYKSTAKGEQALKIAKEELDKFKKDEKKGEYNKKQQQSSDEEQQKYENFHKAISYQEERIQDLQEEMGLLRALATTGIVVNTYIHEIKALTTQLNVGVKEAYACLEEDQDIDSAKEELLKLRELKDKFNSWFKVTIDAVVMDKRKRKKKNIGQIIENNIIKWKSVQNNNIEYKYFENEAVEIRCFPFDFETIISNLITNSSTIFKNYKINKPVITIEIGCIENMYYIKYSDNGPGLCDSFKKEPQKILKYGVTDRRNANGEIVGTGMGLWIVDSIIQNYNGHIDLKKNIEKQSGFFIDLYFIGREN
jgi:signal transduction histidine kinase